MALTKAGFKFSMGRTTINLAPAVVRKEGPSFNLPIGMLAANDQLMPDKLVHFAWWANGGTGQDRLLLSANSSPARNLENGLIRMYCPKPIEFP